MTTVVNIRKEPYDVYIGRAGKGQDGYFGNPYKIGSITDMFGETLPVNTREESIKAYEIYFKIRLETDSEFKQRILQLKDKRLGCFCHPLPCHGDVIAEYLDNIPLSPNKHK